MNYTPEQIERLKEELVKSGMPVDQIPFIISNFVTNSSSKFSHITMSEINEKISKFQEIDLKNISEEDLSLAISEVMNIDVNGNKIQVFMPQTCHYPSGTRFYRVRTLSHNQNDFAQYSKLEAYWNPPAELVKRPGRLNKVHESLLYTSLNPLTTFSELKIGLNQTFALIIYEALETIKMTSIGANRDIPELDVDDNRKLQIYNKFLRDEFTKEVQPGLEHLYRVSEYIAKCYFDLPPRDVQDAWIYPSVAYNGSYNVCFRPDIAKEVLKFVGVIFCTMVDPKAEGFKCHLIGTPTANNNIIFNHVNVAQMKDIFPEFVLNSPDVIDSKQ